MSLRGKAILVAGASSGMGAATARLAATAGARVGLFARRADRLEAVAEGIAANGGAALAMPGDALDPAAAERAVTRTVEHFGRLDALICCVGTNLPERSLPELTLQAWRGLLETNLTAAYVLTQAALPVLRAQRDGLLVHVSSTAAKRADASGVGYQASKAGLVGLAHATMAEERANGIRVTVVFPGFTDTALVDRRPTPPTPEMLANALRPEDVAAMVVAVLELPARAYVPELVLAPSRLT